MIRAVLLLTTFALLATALPAPQVGAPFTDICKPSSCSAGFAGCPGDNITLEAYPVNISSWDSVSNSYTLVGQIMSHAVQEDEGSQFGIFLHGPLMRMEDNKAPGKLIPPIYFSAAFKNKVWRLDNVPTGQPAASNWTGQLTLMGDAVAPSTTYPITDAQTKKLKGFLVAEGNPFFMNHINGSMDILKGGVTYLGSDSGPDGNGEKCTDLFPTATWHPYHGFGQVVNTVDCHVPSGMCFFSVWKFYDDSVPEWMAPDCLYWCNPDDINSPQKCIASGVLRDDKGNKICTQKKGPPGSHVGGATHGFTIGNTDPTNDQEFDLFLIFTGGAGFDEGESSLHKLKVKVLLDNVQTLSMVDFGTDLWKKSVTGTHDAGLDHAWVDATKNLLWVTTFRKANPGVHMMDYKTGRLIYSIRGFDSFFPGQYLYPAGVSGYGTLGREGSYLTIATSTQKGLTVPPILDFGKAALFVMDISKILNVVAYKCQDNQCVPDPGGISHEQCTKICGK